MKLVLLVISVVCWSIAAIIAIAGGNVGSLAANDFFLLGAPFFAAAHL